MARQEQIKRVSTKEAEELAEKDAQRVYESESDKLARVKAKGEDLLENLDDLLDEIDGLLEENASEVLAAYRQRGGQ